MILTLEPMPEARLVRKPDGRGICHRTDDERKTLCGRVIEPDWEYPDTDPQVCGRCTSSLTAFPRMKRLVGASRSLWDAQHGDT